MAKFAIGDRVEATSDHKDGVVVAVFSMMDGNFRYAIEMEGFGALQFVTKENLVFCRAIHTWSESESGHIRLESH